MVYHLLAHHDIVSVIVVCWHQLEVVLFVHSSIHVLRFHSLLFVVLVWFTPTVLRNYLFASFCFMLAQTKA